MQVLFIPSEQLESYYRNIKQLMHFTSQHSLKYVNYWSDDEHISVGAVSLQPVYLQMEYFSGMTLEQVFSQSIQFKIEDK